jgi:hypothetical protein
MFQVPIGTRMKMSTRQKRSWLDRVTPHVNDAARRFREKSASGQMDIRDMWDEQNRKKRQDETDTVDTTERQVELMETATERDSPKRATDPEQPNNRIDKKTAETRAAPTTPTAASDTDEEQDEDSTSDEEERPPAQQTKRKIDFKAWGSLKPHKPPKEDEEDDKKKKKTKKTQRDKQAMKQIVPPGEVNTETDTVRRGRLPKFRNERASAVPNSNPDKETATKSSGSQSRRDTRG